MDHNFELSNHLKNRHLSKINVTLKTIKLKTETNLNLQKFNQSKCNMLNKSNNCRVQKKQFTMLPCNNRIHTRDHLTKYFCSENKLLSTHKTILFLVPQHGNSFSENKTMLFNKSNKIQTKRAIPQIAQQMVT